MPQTMAEKILSRAMGRPVRAGEVVYPEPDLITIHDLYIMNCARALAEFGVERLYAPDKVLVSTDHEPLAVSVQAAERQLKMREVCRRYGISMLFDSGRGGHGHVFPMEMGMVRPGHFVLGYDLHVPNFGAVGALAFYLGVEITELVACGSVWLRVPETIRVNLTGRLQPGITARDVAQRLIADIDAETMDYTVVEYGGPSLGQIGFDGRMTLCNSPIESTAKSAIVEVDDAILEWLRPRTSEPIEPVRSDPGAPFKLALDFDLGLAEPQVAVPPHADHVVGVSTVAGKAIHHASIGSCANGGLSDLRDAARILRGRKVHPDVRLIVTPATQEVARRAAAEGLIEVFADAGVMMTPPGCGVCAIGLLAPLAPGEVSINTATVNEPGRLGSKEAEIYLASPLTVAASAVAGRIADPRDMLAG